MMRSGNHMTIVPAAPARSAVFRQASDVVCRTVGTDAVLVPIRRNVGNLDFIYTITPVAVRVWALLDGGRSIDEIADVICAEFEIDHVTAVADIEELLADLAEAALISQVSDR